MAAQPAQPTSPPVFSRSKTIPSWRRSRPICSGDRASKTASTSFSPPVLPLVMRPRGPISRRWSSSDSGHGRHGQARLPGRCRSDCWPTCWIARAAAVEGDWVAAPLVHHATSGELLLLHGALARPSADSLRSIEALAAIVASALETVRRAQHEQARIRRLEAILEIASQWNQTREMEPLLVQMAEAATRLLASRSGEHLSVGPAQPHAGRPAGAGRGRRRAAHSRRLGRRRPGGPHRPAAAGQHATTRQRDQSPGRSPARLSHAHAAVRAAARQRGRAVRRLRGDQQARRQFHRRRRSRRWPNWPAHAADGPGKHPELASSCWRPTARSSSRRPKACN